MSNDTERFRTRRDMLQLSGALGGALLASGTFSKTASVSSQDGEPAQRMPADSQLNTADILVDTLIRWNVSLVFGIVGDGINSIIEALRKREDRIRFIAVRHEEAAAFMACGYAKHTGRLGVCLATTGPGAIHLMNGLYDAKMDSAPVLAITGSTFHDLGGTHFMQAVDTLALMDRRRAVQRCRLRPDSCRHRRQSRLPVRHRRPRRRASDHRQGCRRP